MAASMTGYARSQYISNEISLFVSIRSVNHRFLDLQLRIPPEVEPLEARIRELVKKHVRRGQLQVTVTLRWHAPGTQLNINQTLIDAYVEVYRAVARRHGIGNDPDLSTLLRVPGMIALNEAELDEQHQALLESAFTGCLSQALEDLDKVRRSEGAGIAEDVRQQARQMAQEIEQLDAARLGTVAEFQKRLESKLQELLGQAGIDPQRILQEAAVLADRTDISEELQRLKSHVERLLAMVEQDNDVGKQIDFLAQELHREANTVLSKTTPLGRGGLPLTEIGLRLKQQIEKVREQAQNLE